VAIYELDKIVKDKMTSATGQMQWGIENGVAICGYLRVYEPASGFPRSVGFNELTRSEFAGEIGAQLWGCR